MLLRLNRVPHGVLEAVLTCTNQHIKSQIVSKQYGLVLFSASTLEREVQEKIYGPADKWPADFKKTYRLGSVEAAGIVGKCLAERASAGGVQEVKWVRPGHYAGKIKAFADALRDGGLSLR